MKRDLSYLLTGLLAAFALFSPIDRAVAITDPMDNVEHTGLHDFTGGLQIDEQPLTNTAARLNQAGISNYTAQVDTNSTTTPTQYTPRYRGDQLQGRLGGTVTVWFAYALTTTTVTTNDWQAYTMPFPAGAVLSQAGTFGLLNASTGLQAAAIGANSAIVTGSVTAGSSVISGLVTHVGASQSSITNGQILTLSARITKISALTASTNVLAAPVNAGDLCTIENVGTNIIVFAAGGNISSTNAITLGGNAARVQRCRQELWAESTTNWAPQGPVWCN